MNWIIQNFPHRSVHTLPANFFLPPFTPAPSTLCSTPVSTHLSNRPSLPTASASPPTLMPTSMPTPMPTPRPLRSTAWRTPAKRLLTQFEPPTYGPTSSLTPPKRPLRRFRISWLPRIKQSQDWCLCSIAHRPPLQRCRRRRRPQRWAPRCPQRPLRCLWRPQLWLQWAPTHLAKTSQWDSSSTQKKTLRQRLISKVKEIQNKSS